MNRQEKKRRVFWCLALYLLFAFIPGLHRALHPAALPAGDLLAGTVPVASAACPDGCEDPSHHHLSGDHDCPVCKGVWNPTAFPHQESRGIPADDGGTDLVQRRVPARRAPHCRFESARAPPENLLL